MVAGKRSSRAGVVVEPVVRLRPAAGGGRVPLTRVAEVQRARILAAAVEIAIELGYGAMSTARVSARAGVSRKTFYELFENREDCFLAVFNEAASRTAPTASLQASPARKARVVNSWLNRRVPLRARSGRCSRELDRVLTRSMRRGWCISPARTRARRSRS